MIDRADPLAAEIVKLVQKVRRKTRVYEHKGTYRLRAWMIPGKDADQNGNSNGKVQRSTFGRPGP